VLAAIAQHSESLPADFVPNLLSVRILLAPEYARLAIERDAERIATLLSSSTTLPETPEAFSAFDWEVHLQLTICSGNPVFTLIFNGFKDLYLSMGKIYFSSQATRNHSRGFYADLLECARQHDSSAAFKLTERIMAQSLANWQQVNPS